MDLVPLQVVMDFLDAEDWPYRQVGDRAILQTAFQGENGAWLCYANCRSEFGQMLFYSIAPQRAPEAARPAVAEYLMRANWGLMIGNFEMDYHDGEVRCKTSLQLENTALTVDLLRPLVFDNVVVMDKYLPGLLAVMAGTTTPAEAIAAAEE
jgi:hypothetical protein